MILNMPSLLSDGNALKVINSIADYKVNDVNEALIKPKTATTLILPWPDKHLSPNQRVHWAKRAKASKQARQIAFSLAQQAGWDKCCVPDPYSIDYLTKRYDLILDFYPPNKRRRDDDNLIAAFKPYRDGIAQALEVDDFKFRTVATIHEKVIKNGQVIVSIKIDPLTL